MGGMARIDDVRFLLDVATDDGELEHRLLASRALVALPLYPDAAGTVLMALRALAGVSESVDLGRLVAMAGAPRPVTTPDGTGADTTAQVRASETAARVRDTLLAPAYAPAGFPGMVSVLGALSVDQAGALLTDLIGQLLGPGLGSTDRIRGAPRIGEVYRALTRDGSRTVIADLPDEALVAVKPSLRTWAGGLLALVDIAQILQCARTLARDRRRRPDALRWLAASGPWLATPVVPPPKRDGEGLQQLQRLLELGLHGRWATGTRRAAPPRMSPTPREIPGPMAHRERTRPGRSTPVGGLVDRAVPEASDPPAGDVEMGGGPAVEPAAAATRTAHALLDAPDQVAEGGTFELKVGLGPSPGHGVSSPGPLTVPAAVFALTVTVVADGFTVLGGATLTTVITVTPDDPYPYAVLRLRASTDPAFAAARTILATYTIGDRFIGVASRAVLVGAGEATAVQPSVRVPPAPEPRRNVDWVLPTDAATRPDLELLVAPGNDANGIRRVFWFLRSPHPSVGEHDFIEAELPAEVATQVKQLIAGVEARPGEPDLGHYVRGVARLVAHAVPDEVWDALGAAAAAVGGSPSVLLATWDPYIPWELARVPQPWCPAEPAYLGAQAVIGRWPYLTRSRSPAPTDRIDLHAMAVVSGTYSDGERLPQAELEAAGLRQAYTGHDVPAKLTDVLACLGGQPASDLLHFAVHGRFTGTGTREGIYLVDGKFLDPVSVAGVETSPARFVFLNACQLGQARQIFGDYAGMAAELLGIGACAVVAPLWEVDDEVARSVAEGFYPAVLAAGDSPATVLRRERCATRGGGENTVAGTRLAYVYYGHPLLRVSWGGPTTRPAEASGPGASH